MDLEDVLAEPHGLQQDSWSLESRTFGQQGQLKVVGWSGKRKSNKFYILHCSVCSEDRELFGEGFFKSPKESLKTALPCGCAISPRWSEGQYSILCKRLADKKGVVFHRLLPPFVGRNTKIGLECKKHGVFNNTNLSTFLNSNRGTGCHGCKADTITERNLKPDEDMIATFMSTGNYPIGTRFWRSVRKTKSGNVAYWKVYCPVCDSVSESTYRAFQKGCLSCNCKKHNQEYAYINIVDDCIGTCVLKFGIANNPLKRVEEQNSKSCHTVVNYGIWKFPTSAMCKAAESFCKNNMVCGVISKSDMRDGYTETTYPYNMDEIVLAYEAHGGVRIR